MDKRFIDIINLIKASRANALKTVNSELINLYWNIGEYISVKIQKSDGDSQSLKSWPNLFKIENLRLKVSQIKICGE